MSNKKPLVFPSTKEKFLFCYKQTISKTMHVKIKKGSLVSKYTKPEQKKDAPGYNSVFTSLSLLNIYSLGDQHWELK